MATELPVTLEMLTFLWCVLRASMMFWMSFFKVPASVCSLHSAMTYRIEVHDDENYDRGGWTMRKVMSKEED